MTQIDKINNFLSKKAHSKKGFTLVEAAAAVMILAIVCVGVLNAVAFSREMVYSNNSKEKASDIAQLVADEVMQSATGMNPADVDAPAQIQAKVNEIANETVSDSPNIQFENIGKVNCVTAFDVPTNEDELIQYVLTPIADGTDIESDTDVTVSHVHQKATFNEAVMEGWDIRVRVYYKEIGAGGDYRVVDVSAFAPSDIAS